MDVNEKWFYLIEISTIQLCFFTSYLEALHTNYYGILIWFMYVYVVGIVANLDVSNHHCYLNVTIFLNIVSFLSHVKVC